MAKAHRSTKNFKVSMKPSTISQIHFDEEDELISLIHQLDCDEIGDTELFQIENLSSCSKKQIARTLVRNDRRTLNQQKQEKYLKKLSDKQRRAHQHSLIDQIQERDLSQIHLQYTDRSHVVTVEQPFSISKLKEVCRRVFDLGEMQFEFFIESELVDDDVLSILLSDTVVSLQVVLAPIKMPFFAMEEEAYLDCLPILRDSVKADLLAAIESSPVVVLVGDTGCGYCFLLIFSD